MKRIFIILALLIIGAGITNAAAPRIGSWTESDASLSSGYHQTTLFWTADSTGTVASHTTTQIFRGFILQIITDPDTSKVPATADSSGRFPTASYDIVLNTSKTVAGSGTKLDITAGALQNRSTNNTEMVTPKNSTEIIYQFFNNSTLTAVVSGNAIPNACGYIKIIWLAR